ncbi:iron uptake system protein EfeO [Salinicola avicenniae]|uniref:iron uptake system protein EfeO n=1 Tax=Salinicola avicenniae TaxID=2916836 RepID=UPI002072CF13|nr:MULTISPECIES: iron uptake system protein EfeO [unclassified Salinicola]
MTARDIARPPAAPSAPSPTTLRLGVLGAFLLMLAALATFALSLKTASPGGDSDALVTVTAQGCEPAHLEVEAGRRTFTVVNRSPRAIEWEVVDGVMVLAERENIAPGLRQPLSVSLAPGDYAMTCGLLSNPRGTLHVIPNGDETPPALAATDFIGPLAEYRVYTTLELRHLKRQVAALDAAIAEGDLALARQRYHDARRRSRHLAVPTGLFGDLDQRLDARAAYFADREADPDFVGFHRLALSLFERDTTHDLAPIVERLAADVDQLSQRLAATTVPPAQLADGSARVLLAWHDAHASGDTLTPLARADLAGLSEGVDKIVGLLSPLLAQQAPETLTRVQSALSSLQQDLPDSEDDTSRDAASVTDTGKLLQESAALAHALASVNHALALSG